MVYFASNTLKIGGTPGFKKMDNSNNVLVQLFTKAVQMKKIKMTAEKIKCEGMMFFFRATHLAEDDDRAELNQAV